MRLCVKNFCDKTMEETLTRQIKVFCPTHQSVFEVADAAKIICEIKEHALSNDFPNGEFWEYCCDCQTFSPSNLEVGGKAQSVCQHCERETNGRFVCGDCKTVSINSGEDTKGKIFRVDFNAKTIEPSCAGCLKDFAGAGLKLHKCEEAQGIFLTSRKVCPFCKKEVAPTVKKKPVEQNTAKIGTSAAKTKLLGSICPTCGAASEPDSVFCQNCGQSLKATTPTPKQQPALPPNMPPIPTQVINPATVGANVKPTATSSNAKGCLAVIGVLFGAILLCAIIQGIMKSNNSTTSTTGSTSITSNYRGTIGAKSVSISMTLTREGSSLKGTASTSKTDFLRGTVENNGDFVLNAYSADNIQTGIYRGRINSDGSIGGTWTNPNGGQGTPFYLNKD